MFFARNSARKCIDVAGDYQSVIRKLGTVSNRLFCTQNSWGCQCGLFDKVNLEMQNKNKDCFILTLKSILRSPETVGLRNNCIIFSNSSSSRLP